MTCVLISRKLSLPAKTHQMCFALISCPKLIYCSCSIVPADVDIIVYLQAEIVDLLVFEFAHLEHDIFLKNFGNF